MQTMSIRSMLHSEESKESVMDLDSDLDDFIFKNKKNFIKTMKFDEENFIRKLTYEQR